MSPWRASEAIQVERLRGPPVARQRIEIVERKGIGHPDTICDEIMESAALRLAAEYRRRFGRPLHFNLDKAFLAAGRSAPALGGGRVLEPMRLMVGDRATREFDGQEIPVKDIVSSTARDWIRQHLRYVDSDTVVVQDEIKPTMPELAGLFAAGEPGANDTSVGAAYAPLSPTEQATLSLEHYLNSDAFHKEFREAGEDVKVMLVRRGNRLDATVAVAFVDRHVPTVQSYTQSKESIRQRIAQHLATTAPWSGKTSVALNTLDRPEQGPDGLYLTVTGTSAEGGDSGQVGRGNRPNGVIGVNRPMSAEAVPGKNMASHVGKIYNLLAQRIADRLHSELGVEEAYVRLVSRIGEPLAQPSVASLQLVSRRGQAWRPTVSSSRAIVEDALAGLPQFLRELEQGKVGP